MAAVTLTKVEARPVGTLGAANFWESDPSIAWYETGTVNDADTIAFSNWTGPAPEAVYCVPGTTNEGFSAEWALSSGTLTITLQGSSTAGGHVGIKR